LLLAAEVGAVFMIARTEAFPWLFASLVRSLETSGPVRSLGRSGPDILAATMAEGVAFTVTSTAISLVLRAPKCQGRLPATFLLHQLPLAAVLILSRTT